MIIAISESHEYNSVYSNHMVLLVLHALHTRQYVHILSLERHEAWPDQGMIARNEDMSYGTIIDSLCVSLLDPHTPTYFVVLFRLRAINC